jgi:hypothetical protein
MESLESQRAGRGPGEREFAGGDLTISVTHVVVVARINVIHFVTTQRRADAFAPVKKNVRKTTIVLALTLPWVTTHLAIGR